MPLKEIKHRLEDSDTQILSLLTRKISVVDEKIRELELIKKVLSTKKETLEKGGFSLQIFSRLTSLSLGGV